MTMKSSGYTVRVIGSYDVMQVCENGHTITTTAKTQPEHRKTCCPGCGAKTITQCPKCNTEIQGQYYSQSTGRKNPSRVPAHCHQCGEPYPWTTAGAVVVDAKPRRLNVTPKNDIFVVHGHDNEMKQHVARTLTSLGLNPIILHERPSSGKTIIEKIEHNSDVPFAVVLLSCDDLAYPVGGDAKSPKPRPRQNVISELGYFIGKLGRDRVFTLKRGDNLELPSDFMGVVYTPYDEHGSWRLELVKELKAAGFTVDANKL
jgi:hypothetical protein